MESTEIYLEIGRKRICAVALNWPGWCRCAKDEVRAAQTLLDYGPRYAAILRAAGLEVKVPEAVSSFEVVDRLEGNATTDERRGAW
jgi:hypothetical protein